MDLAVIASILADEGDVQNLVTARACHTVRPLPINHGLRTLACHKTYEDIVYNRETNRRATVLLGVLRHLPSILPLRRGTYGAKAGASLANGAP